MAYRKILPVLLTVLIISGCDWLQNTPDVPDAPVMLGNPADTLLVETGIDAVPEASWIQVQWRTTGLTDIKEYRIYRFSFDDDSGLKTTQDSLIATVPDNEIVADTGLFIDEDVHLDIRYYYYIRSVNYKDEMSDPSGHVHYKLISKISQTKLESPRGSITDSRPVFKLADLTADISVNTFVVKLYDVNTSQMIWASGLIDPFNQSTVLYNYNKQALPGFETLNIDRYYKWRVDARGRNDKSGSESGWVEFFIVNN